MAVRTHPASPTVVGAILKVKELVTVEEVDQLLTPADERTARRSDPGYVVEDA